MAEQTQTPARVGNASTGHLAGLRPQVVKVGKAIEPVSTSFIDTIKHLIGWISLNLAPVIGLLALLALAGIGAVQVLGNHLSHDQRTLAAVVIVGCFASLAFTSQKK